MLSGITDFQPQLRDISDLPDVRLGKIGPYAISKCDLFQSFVTVFLSNAYLLVRTLFDANIEIKSNILKLYVYINI